MTTAAVAKAKEAAMATVAAADAFVRAMSNGGRGGKTVDSNDVNVTMMTTTTEMTMVAVVGIEAATAPAASWRWWRRQRQRRRQQWHWHCGGGKRLTERQQR